MTCLSTPPEIFAHWQESNSTLIGKVTETEQITLKVQNLFYAPSLQINTREVSNRIVN